MNWRGRPLTSHPGHRADHRPRPPARTGLTVHAELDTAKYPTGTKIPDVTMTALADSGAP